MPNPTRTVKGETREWNGSAWVPVPAAAQVPMYHPGLNDSPTDAALAELERTGGEAAIGLAKSPIDLVKNTLGMIAHPIDAASGAIHAIAHPVDTFNALGNDPRAAGSALGQLLLGEAAAPHIPAAIEAAPETIGRGAAAVGRGMEAAGNSRLGRLAEYGGGADLIYRGDPKGAVIAAAPTVLKYGGKGLQKLGSTIEGLKKAAVEAPKPDSVLSGITLSPDAVARNVEATNLRDVEGFSHAQAGKLAGIPGAGESKEIPYKASNIPAKYSRPFPDLEPVSSPEPAEEVGRSVLSAPGGSIDALKTAANPDLMDQYIDSLKGGIGSGKQSFEMFGQKYVPNEIGSHVAAPLNLVDELERSGGGGYDAATELNPDTIESMFQQNNPTFKALQSRGVFNGDRTSPTLDPLREAAFKRYVNK